MSKQDKKETTAKENVDQTIQNNAQVFNRAIEETTQTLNQVFDESKKSIERNITEAKSQIPRYTQSINEVQEQAIQATRDIADNYLEYQKQAIDSFQSIFTPYVENANNQLVNNQALFRRIPEIYSKIANNYAENSVAVSRIINNIAFSNVELVKNVISNTKEQSKQFAEIGKRNVKVYEAIERDNLNTSAI
jgi:vacuolar-type H+-ATPase subunit H